MTSSRKSKAIFVIAKNQKKSTGDVLLKLTDEQSEKCGAFYSVDVQGTIKIENYDRPERIVSVGIAAIGESITSFASVESNIFSQEERKKVYELCDHITAVENIRYRR